LLCHQMAAQRFFFIKRIINIHFQTLFVLQLIDQTLKN